MVWSCPSPLYRFALTGCLLLCLGSTVRGQHDHGSSSDVKPPRVFLDKSPRIVEFQLKRLDNQRLLLVEREDDDPKYLPVHVAILKREGIASADREAALAAVAKINQSNPVAELLGLLETLDADSPSDRRVSQQLSRLLLSQPLDALQASAEAFSEAAGSDRADLQPVGFAGLVTAGKQADALKLASDSSANRVALLNSVRLLRQPKSRNELRALVVESLAQNQTEDVKLAALKALRGITDLPSENFKLAATLVDSDKLRRSAIQVLRAIPRENRDPAVAGKLAGWLVEYAEKTPPANRTSDAFVEAMQLADQLFGLIDESVAKQLRERLSKVTVRVILIHTVEEEMRYDVPWFAVQAGTDVQIILKNEDLMPHNLVLTQPGMLQDVALEGAALGPRIGESGKQYVPVSDDVVAATEMIAAENQGRLTFVAPTEPGEYPYVCTFPGHWMRMYGVMVVVDDLAAFQRNPVEPKDPVGSNRAFVKSWTVDDFREDLESGMRGRTASIGAKIFEEATCATCHQVQGKGKVVGPDLTDVWTRWKGDTAGVLREVLEPSHKIEPKYIVRKVITLDGEIISGIVVAEDSKSISILPNPESPEPTVIPQDDIDDMVNSSVSIMPKALMDRFTKDEILELLAYLKSVDPQK